MNLTLKRDWCDLKNKKGVDMRKRAIHQEGRRGTEAELFGVKRMMGGDVRDEK